MSTSAGPSSNEPNTVTDVKGWNDPPQVAYSATADSAGGSSTSLRGRTSLNRRVPFPMKGPQLLTSDCSASDANSVQLMPPTDTAVNVITVFPALGVTSSPVATSSCNDDGLRDTEIGDLHGETLESLRHILNLCLPTLQKRTADDIAKRLATLSNMWLAGKLNEDVQLRMHRLTTALHKGNHDEANNLHLALIVDHVGQVSSWMVGIKHLIHESRNIGPVTESIDSTPIVVEPPLLPPLDMSH